MAELAPQELIASLRRPKLLFTEAYLNDQILSNTDERFHPETALRQLNEIKVVERDGGRYAVVDIGEAESTFYPIQMSSPIIDRSAYVQYIDREFKEFI